MANIIHVSVENPDELRNASAYGTSAIIRLQSGAAEAGPFTNEASEPIIAGTRSYTLYDTDGTSSTWYRTRYENGAGTVVSDWSPAFQVGDETGGLICSLYDVEQRIGALSVNDRETVVDIIRRIGAQIEGYCERWFIPRPASGTSTFLVHTQSGYLLRFPKGITSISTLSIASSNQPPTGGSYTAVASTGFWLDPQLAERTPGWPATRIVLSSTGSARFYDAEFGASIVGQAGWPAVPADIQGIAQDAVIRAFIGKESAASAVSVGPSGAITLLRGMSPENLATLDWYRDWPT